jgi:hypothetical protein
MFDLFDDCQTFDALVACADGGAFDTFADDDTIADDRYFTDSDGVLILIDSNVPTVGTFGKIRLLPLLVVAVALVAVDSVCLP